MIGTNLRINHQGGGEKMNKRIFGVFFSLVVVAMFIVPVMAKTETEVTYTKERVGPMKIEHLSSGESHVFHILRSEQSGFIYEGDEPVGDPVYSFTAVGKNMINRKQDIQIWHFDYVWTSTEDENSGFKGRLNGNAGADSLFTVQGVLQGFGELKGQKLVVKAERQTPMSAGIAIFTGLLIEY